VFGLGCLALDAFALGVLALGDLVLGVMVLDGLTLGIWPGFCVRLACSKLELSLHSLANIFLSFLIAVAVIIGCMLTLKAMSKASSL
jgi:hypothetical protein